MYLGSYIDPQKKFNNYEDPNMVIQVFNIVEYQQILLSIYKNLIEKYPIQFSLNNFRYEIFNIIVKNNMISFNIKNFNTIIFIQIILYYLSNPNISDDMIQKILYKKAEKIKKGILIEIKRLEEEIELNKQIIREEEKKLKITKNKESKKKIIESLEETKKTLQKDKDKLKNEQFNFERAENLYNIYISDFENYKLLVSELFYIYGGKNTSKKDIRLSLIENIELQRKIYIFILKFKLIGDHLQAYEANKKISSINIKNNRILLTQDRVLLSFCLTNNNIKFISKCTCKEGRFILYNL
jgi:hypothetical protein